MSQSLVCWFCSPTVDPIPMSVSGHGWVVSLLGAMCLWSASCKEHCHSGDGVQVECPEQNGHVASVQGSTHPCRREYCGTGRRALHNLLSLSWWWFQDAIFHRLHCCLYLTIALRGCLVNEALLRSKHSNCLSSIAVRQNVECSAVMRWRVDSDKIFLPTYVQKSTDGPSFI